MARPLGGCQGAEETQRKFVRRRLGFNKTEMSQRHHPSKPIRLNRKKRWQSQRFFAFQALLS
jgi:hypothetical protein